MEMTLAPSATTPPKGGPESIIFSFKMSKSKGAQSKKRSRRENVEDSAGEGSAAPPTPAVVVWEFYSQGGWHDFCEEQCVAIARLIDEGLVAEELKDYKKKASEKRIRSQLGFYIVPNRHWFKPARCRCCKGGVPLKLADQM